MSWIGFINTDLHDYDLIKQKSALQHEQIKGLQAIASKQKEISVRKEYKLSSYGSIILQLQNQNKALQTDLKAVKKQRNKARFEVWAWRGGFIIYTGLKLYQWLK